MLRQRKPAVSQEAEALQCWPYLLPLYNELQKRLTLAEKAIALGRGGVS